MLSRDFSTDRRFGARFIAAVVAPVLLLALGLTGFAVSALRTAAHQADRVSTERQAREVRLALDAALDELALSQAGVAIWNLLDRQLRQPAPDWTWVDDNVGTWLNATFAHDMDAILGTDGAPRYVMRDGVRAAPARYADYAAAARPLILAARGLAADLPNPHERLAGRRAHPHATARTSPRAVHATDLVTVGARPAIMSVMRIIPEGSAMPARQTRGPLLVSLRYLDGDFARRLARVQLVADARIAARAEARPGEQVMPLVSSRGTRAGYLIWRPDLPGRSVWHMMLPSAAAALAALLAALAALIASVAKLVRSDARSLARLNAAHLALQAKEAQAHHLAYHDTLTALPNRALFNSLADQALAAAADRGGARAVLLIDLDRFKQVNDTLGHLGGDQLIQLVAARLQSCVESGDVVARLGGDEFAVLLADRVDERAVGAVAGAMVAAMREPFSVLGTQVFVGASIGIAPHPRCSGDRAELMRMADIAMYRAKAEGRDAYRFFTADMDESVKTRRAIERDLRAAIAARRELTVHYQPRMDAAGARVIGLEALVRWHHPTRGLLAPDAFIAVAEETGLIGALGSWVVRDACAVARAWPALSIAVNLSPVQFRARGMAAELIALVRQAGVSPQQFELEVTESILLDDDVAVRGALAELRGAGFRIALDDFGTGYSSLGYLSKFEVDKIKIDQSFTRRLGESDDAAAIIQAVVRLGHAMGLSVSAEGVETREQRAFLEHAGCNELQGFLFSAAVPAASLPPLLHRAA
ncbi:EAL domain-containing protein [Sphingomonas sp. BK235]|uniref:putative bifunctional diguanylate cyclase/phosphodiesterase n=1 Tax=Sphingomonas sp. BK235 TaxID=2512131 RepID=UPI0010D23DDD|nr:EAL domain-containing protein [Sphingomonas sp. BK235]TCP34106.1 periplasmic sensor diguanylate cyclase/phosphodiesterase [Sphingomonas sp. BK235]